MTDALNTFGAILTFAANNEALLAHFYQQAVQVSHDAQREQFEGYHKKTGKRQQRLIAIRQENVTEIVLEPITGLNIMDYELSPRVPDSAAQAVEIAIQMESRMARFYAEAGPKLNVTEPRRAFARFAQETAERVEELQA
jgi:rubrerythrin